MCPVKLQANRLRNASRVLPTMANVSIVRDSGLSYPAKGPYSPPERYPEYRYPDLSNNGNGVYAAVRQCFVQAGLDAGRFGTPEWNPLGQWIKPAQRVFVLCNFVHHRRPNESQAAFASKCTHGSVLRACGLCAHRGWSAGTRSIR